METKPAVLAEVVAIRAEVNASAVSLVEEVLERLRSGVTLAVAVVEVKKGRLVATGWVDSPSGSYHELNSGAATLASRLAHHGN